MSFEQFLKVIMAIGIPTIITCCVYIGRKLECLDNLKKSVEDIIAKYDEANKQIGDHKVAIATIKSTVGIPGSPMHPNEKGKEILQNAKFNDIYPSIKDELFEKLEGMGTFTLYDIEVNSQTLLTEMSSRKEFNPIKSYIVNNPTELGGGLTLELVFMIASWIIRDDYSKEKNITE